MPPLNYGIYSLIYLLSSVSELFSLFHSSVFPCANPMFNYFSFIIKVFGFSLELHYIYKYIMILRLPI